MKFLWRLSLACVLLGFCFLPAARADITYTYFAPSADFSTFGLSGNLSYSFSEPQYLP
jgi:hypothetical protein